jgi:hypothetical protein
VIRAESGRRILLGMDLGIFQNLFSAQIAYRVWQNGHKYVGLPINPAILVLTIGCEHARHGSVARP